MKMKTRISKLFALSVVMFAFTASMFGQASATATAAATIVTPISIAKTVDMNFGNVAVSATTGGTVVLAPAGTRTTGGAGGVTLPATAGTVAAASFTVTGAGSYTYAITLPAGSTTIDDNATHTMTVDTWTSTPATTGTLSAGGSQTLLVGATLNVAAAQTAGSYLSDTPFTVTVNYN